MTVRVLVFAGSLRRDSYNKKLARVAADAAREAGADVTYVDLADLPMPLYDGDLEAAEGLPAHAKRLKTLMKEHQAFLIASPEYNSSVSGVLKNALDWASRAEPNEPALAAYKGKVAGLLAASPGQLGGLRGLVTLRSILGNLQMLVIPEQLAVPKADAAFAADGTLVDPKQRSAVQAIAARVVRVAGAITAAR